MYPVHGGGPCHEVALVLEGLSLASPVTEHPLMILDVAEFMNKRCSYDELGIRL